MIVLLNHYPALIFVILIKEKNIKFFLIGCVVYYRIVSLNEFFLYRNRMRRAQIWAAKTRIIRQVKNETPTPSRRRSNLPPKNWRLARIKLHQRRQPQSLRSRLHPNPRTPKLSLHPQPIPLLKLQSEKWKKIERKMTFTSSTFSRKTHEKKGSSESTQTILQTPKTILAKHEK